MVVQKKRMRNLIRSLQSRMAAAAGSSESIRHAVLVPVKPDPYQYIRHGYNPAVQTVPVNLRQLTDEDRELVADYFVQATEYEGLRVQVTSGTTEALLSALHERQAASAAKELETARQRAELLEQARAVFVERRTLAERRWLTLGHKGGEGCFYEVLLPDWPSGVQGHRGVWELGRFGLPVDEVVHEIGAGAWVADLDALNEQSRIAAQSAYEHELAEMKATYEKGSKILCAWAETREDLRTILTERRGNWMRKLENLWIEAQVPEGYSALNSAVKILDNSEPTRADFEALEVARKACDDIVVSDAQLALVRGYTASPGAERSMVGVAVTAPTGHSRTFWRRVEAAK
ncbi:hypothetical protein [Nocardia goodfellowii]|uniref:Uncharacterized protein n=1 Tax=Nocardia goodfellowii TaxID=882446 RepID=A0ABS4QPG6_9NOCA|nr:hypothetical protein [Nocardia goodfellowii]MBP2193611.1 hypothetical protein [Nocardia goodfellowii]